jgi:hypothetical protein
MRAALGRPVQAVVKERPGRASRHDPGQSALTIQSSHAAVLLFPASDSNI